jgi:hypothetical protein
MGRLTKRRMFAIGVVVTCTCTVSWTPSAASDQTTPPESYVETIHRLDCPTDEHCRPWHRCAVCDADRHP